MTVDGVGDDSRHNKLTTPRKSGITLRQALINQQPCCPISCLFSAMRAFILVAAALDPFEVFRKRQATILCMDQEGLSLLSSSIRNFSLISFKETSSSIITLKHVIPLVVHGDFQLPGIVRKLIIAGFEIRPEGDQVGIIFIPDLVLIKNIVFHPKRKNINRDVDLPVVPGVHCIEIYLFDSLISHRQTSNGDARAVDEDISSQVRMLALPGV